MSATQSKPKFTAPVRRGFEFIHAAGTDALADRPPKTAAERKDIESALRWMEANFEKAGWTPGKGA